MTSKCDERILKEMKSSFKLSESRKHKSTALSTGKTWQPVTHKPKVALQNTQKIQEPPHINLMTNGKAKSNADSLILNLNIKKGKRSTQTLPLKGCKRPKLENGITESKQHKGTDEDFPTEYDGLSDNYDNNSSESVDEEESSEISESEYSCGSDDDFFNKPEVHQSKELEHFPLQWEDSEESAEELPWQVELPEVQADITKVLVFDEMMPKPDLESHVIDGEELDMQESLEGSEKAEDTEEEEEETEVEVETEAEEETEEVENEEDVAYKNESVLVVQPTDVSDGVMEISSETPVNVTTDQFYPASGMKDAQIELTVFENSFKTNNVLAVLKQDIELYGTVILTLLSGRITINGYKARPNVPVTIYSPKGYNWVVVSPMTNKKAAKAKIDWNELNESFSRAQLENIVNNFDGEQDAIVLLQRNSGAQSMLNIFTKHMAENVFPLLNAANRPHHATEYILNCLVQSADLKKSLQVPSAWSKLVLHANSRFLVAGGKGVGKSTLLRYMLNRHLERFPRMLLIDLDIGQPELFLPQTVSCTVIDGPLLGAGYFQKLQPDRAYAVGHVNIVMCAEQYIRAVRQLLKYCCANKSYSDIPWLINTMGYNKGFGMELMKLLVDCVKPTDVVQLTSPILINNFEKPLTVETLWQVAHIIYAEDEFKVSGQLPQYKLHQLQSAVPKLGRHERRWQMSAKDMRYANLLARLSSCLRGNAKNLNECQPVQVNLDELQIMHLTQGDYTRDELLAGMEANLVFLCKGGEQPLECYGIGVVRAIDYEAGKLYLLPAMPLGRLTQVNCLALGGDMCLPQGFFKDQGAGVANNVPFVFIIDDNRSSKSIQQIYFRAPGFLGHTATPKA